MTELEMYALLRGLWTQKGWPVWTKPYDLNVFGIRNAVRTTDTWDDVFGVFYTDSDGVHHVDRFVASTDPGGYYLQNPMTSFGTIVLEPGYHRGMWRLGTHTGYPALQQVGTITYRRDNDRDLVIESDGLLITSSGNGVNGHHGYDAATVGRNSAGCQVMRMKKALARVLELLKRQIAAGHGDKVSYGLVDEAQDRVIAPVLRIAA